jgi:hypothetical protein
MCRQLPVWQNWMAEWPSSANNTKRQTPTYEERQDSPHFPQLPSLPAARTSFQSIATAYPIICITSRRPTSITAQRALRPYMQSRGEELGHPLI